MSDSNGDLVQVVGAGDDRPAWRPPGGLLLILAGLVVGLAAGVLLTRPGTSSDAVNEPPPPTTTAPPDPETTTTTVADSRLERYRERIRELESELAAAQFQLGLETNPAEYALGVDCDTSQRNMFGGDWQESSYFVGPVWFFRLIEILSDEEPFEGVVAGVEPGDSVTLVVPVSERGNYSLLWNPATGRGDDTVASGESAVTLRACDGYQTAFLGGFATTKQYCAPLDLYFGDNTEPERIFLPFGGVDCPDGTTPLAKPEVGPVPDVTGSTLRDARLAIRLADLAPSVSDGDPIDPEGMVWGQEPGDGGTYQPGTIIGLRTCQPADHVVATYQERIEGTGVIFSDAWMAPSLDNTLESWYFVSALVTGGPTDGQIATWALPGFGPGAGVDSENTPNLSFPANEVSQGFNFGDRRFTPGQYGVDDWLDLDGAIASQRCVSLSRTG